MRKSIRLAIRLLLGVLAGMFIGAAHAAPDSIAIVLSEDSEPYQEFASRFRANLDASGGRNVRVSVLGVAKPPSNGAFLSQDIDLVVAVGVRATEALVGTKSAVPLLGVLLPRQAYTRLKKEAGDRDPPFSAIYLDQPLPRRLALIVDALPTRKRVGAVLGPESAGELRALQMAVREKGLTLVAEHIAEADDLLPALKRVLMESDVLLALPDSLVFSRATAQSILLTSYRAQDPLIAYSQSYVNAGALAAVHSTPAQIAQQAAELVMKLSRSSPVSLPAPQYPKYFSVSVNTQVARSMGIAIADENVLRERLMAEEARP